MDTSRVRWVAALTVTALVSLPAGSVIVEPAAPPSARQPSVEPASKATPDFDRDGKADFAFTDYDDARGRSVGVRYGTGRIQIFDGGEGNYSMGGGLNAGDLNGDGYTDLAFNDVGKSAQSVRTLLVCILSGSSTGLSGTRQCVSGPKLNDRQQPSGLTVVKTPVRRLVASITESPWSTDPNDSRRHSARGSLVVFKLAANGAPAANPTLLRPGSGKLPKLSENGSFGTEIAASGSQLFVGAPEAKVGSRKEAGAIMAIIFSTSAVSSAEVITQATKGVVGAVTSGSRFGYSLAARDGYLVVGTPRDHVGRIKRTGSVQVFTISGAKLTPRQRISQATKGVPGKAERYDRLGASVAIGEICSGVPSVIVGGPGENVAVEHEYDGSVWVVPLTKKQGCSSRQLWAGHGLGGRPRSGRSVGDEVAVIRDRGDTDKAVIAGLGSISEGPGPTLDIWSPKTGVAFHKENLYAELVAGR